MPKRLVLWIAACATALLGACSSEEHRAPSLSSTTPLKVSFVDVTRKAGLHFVHRSGAFGAKWLPETMGSGLCWLDYDGDGWEDLFLANGREWTEEEVQSYLSRLKSEGTTGSPTAEEIETLWRHHPKHPATQALYRNRGDGTLEEVTGEVGLAETFYALGCAAGDYDNDGDPDLYVTAWGRNRLYRNDGGRFVEVGREAGVADEGFGASCTWWDYDRDGDLDLYVCNYVEWSPELDLWCTRDKIHKYYCTPELYRGQSGRLFQNQGNGTFLDVTEKAGMLHPDGKSLGVVVLDFNNDEWPDLAVANDTEEDLLYRNRRDGTFEEVGVLTGMAVSEQGKARAGMGVDAGDYDNCSRESLLVGNFSNEMLGLYHNEGEVFFDAAPGSGVGRESRLYLTFGCFFFNFDNDGWLDILAATGHIDPDWQKVEANVPYAQRPLLFHNQGGGTFEEIGRKVGLQRELVSRGAAFCDYDRDGDLDFALSTNNGPAVLYRNEGGNQNAWLRVRLRGDGKRINRDAIGAKVLLEAGSLREVRFVRAGHSYCSQSELTLHFGLGSLEQVDRLTILWPDGTRKTLGPLPARQTLEVTP